jgi:hypothetical protein
LRIRVREFGATEATLGLSLLTVLSLVLGYVALQRLGGTGEAPPIEIRRDTPAGAATGVGITRPDDENPLRVLPAQDAESADVPRVSQRPDWNTPTMPEARSDFDFNGIESLWPRELEGTDEVDRELSGPSR